MLLTIIAYALAIVAGVIGNVLGFHLFLPLTYFAAKSEDGATAMRLQFLRQFLGSVVAFPISLAAACFVLTLFGVSYGWLIFLIVAVQALADVFGAKIAPFAQQSGTILSVVVIGFVYFTLVLR
jgi:hypothetical protein